jgi:hypothetical protein
MGLTWLGKGLCWTVFMSIPSNRFVQATLRRPQSLKEVHLGRSGASPRRMALSWPARQARDAPRAMSPMMAASSCGRDHIGQWLVGRSTQVTSRSSARPPSHA